MSCLYKIDYFDKLSCRSYHMQDPY